MSLKGDAEHLCVHEQLQLQHQRADLHREHQQQQTPQHAPHQVRRPSTITMKNCNMIAAHFSRFFLEMTLDP